MSSNNDMLLPSARIINERRRLKIQKRLTLSLIEEVQELNAEIKHLESTNESLRGKLNSGMPSYGRR